MSKNFAVSIAITGNAASYLSAVGVAKNATASLGNSSVLLKQTVAALNQEYIKIGRTIDQLHLKQEKLNRLNDKYKSARAEIGGQLGGTAALAIGAALPIKFAIDFESAMADVRKVVDFQTPADFVRFGEIIKSMSREIPIAATGLAQIAASGGQLGIKETDLPDFTRTVAKMATAFDMMPQEAGDSMAKLANAYSIPIKDIVHLGDAINHLSNNSPAKANDLVRSMGRIAGVSKMFGLSEIQAASLANAFISLGKAPEVAGTAINGMLTKLATADKQGAKFQRALAQIGTDAASIKDLINNNAQGTLIGFLKAIEQMPKKDQMGTLVDLFGLEYADDIATMVGSLDQYIKSVELVGTKKSYSGSMDKEFATRADTTANRLILLKNSMVELGVGVGETLRPALNDILETITPMIHSASEWVQKNQGLVRSIATVVVGLIGLKVASLGVRYGFALAGSGATSLMQKLLGVGLRFQLLRGMLTAGAPRMALALRMFGAGEGTATKMAGGIAKYGGVLMGAAKAALPWIGRIALTLMRLTPIGLALSAVGLIVYKYWQPIKGFFVGLWQGLSSVAGPAIKSLLQSVMSFGSIIGNAFLKFSLVGIAFRLLRTIAAPVLNSIASGVRTVWNWFTNLLNPVNDVGNKAQNLGQRVGSALGNIIKAIISLPTKFLKLGGDIVSGLVNGIQNKIGEAVSAISGLGNAVANKFKSSLGIHSPSRIFMGYGDNVAQGTAIGIQRSTAQASKAADGMAHSTLNAAIKVGTPNTGNAINRGSTGASSGAVHNTLNAASKVGTSNAGNGINRDSKSGASDTGMTVHLTQNFNLDATGKDIKGQIQQAAQVSMQEFERMMKRVLTEQKRRSIA